MGRQPAPRPRTLRLGASASAAFAGAFGLLAGGVDLRDVGGKSRGCTSREFTRYVHVPNAHLLVVLGTALDGTPEVAEESALLLGGLTSSNVAFGGGVETAHTERIVTHAINELEVRDETPHVSQRNDDLVVFAGEHLFALFNLSRRDQKLLELSRDNRDLEITTVSVCVRVNIEERGPRYHIVTRVRVHLNI